MKLDKNILIDLNNLMDASQDCSIKELKSDLESVGASVLGYFDRNGGNAVMVISGPEVDYSDVESAFDEANVDVDDFIIYDDDIDFDGWEEITDWDQICEFFLEKQDELDECDGETNECDDDTNECDELNDCEIPSYESLELDSDLKEVNEKKRDCCPKKKSVNENNKIPYKDKTDKKSNNKRMVPLSEALNGNIEKRVKPTDVDSIIDSIIGKKNSKSVVESAMSKAKKEAEETTKSDSLNENLEFLREKVGEKVFNEIRNAIKEGKKTMHENVRIAGKNMVDYSLEELQKIYEKVSGQVENMKAQTTDGLNEADAATFNDKLAKKERLCTILHEEIEFRSALKEAEDDFKMDFANLNPNAEEDNSSEENADNNSEESAENAEEKSDDDEKNPDEDEEIEIGSIVVTLVNKEAAEDLQKDLIDEGIPEDVIEVVSSKEDEESEESEENSEEENAEAESGNEENAESEKNADENKEEKAEESTETSEAPKLNEDDTEDAENAEGGENAESDNAEENADENSEEEEESYKVILTNTDYAETLKTVLVDKWGMTEEEFTEMIGGEFVEEENAEDEGNKEEDESSSEDAENSDDNNEEKKDDSDEEDVDDFDPSKVFNDI